MLPGFSFARNLVLAHRSVTRMTPSSDWHLDFAHAIKQIHIRLRDTVLESCKDSDLEELSAVDGQFAGDTIYAIDRISESVLVAEFERLADKHPLILVAEGLGNDGTALLGTNNPDDAQYQVIVDPIDGTRGLMYQKRSAWILTGVARNHGDSTNLSHIEVAVQTEIPTTKQHLCDCLWATTLDDHAVGARRDNLVTGESSSFTPQPSSATTIAHGFGGLSRFFPGVRDILAKIDDAVHLAILGSGGPGEALAFEDQYISSAGQLYELMVGHDRWIADVRPLVDHILTARGLSPGLCSHPYDLCTELIARRLGIIISDHTGQPLRAKLNVTDNVTWIGYANKSIRDLVHPALQRELRRIPDAGNNSSTDR